MIKNVIGNGNLYLNTSEWLHVKPGYSCKSQAMNRSRHDRMTKVNSEGGVNKGWKLDSV